MPEYLTSGVYVEETSFRSRSIEGVPTSTFGMTSTPLESGIRDAFAWFRIHPKN